MNARRLVTIAPASGAPLLIRRPRSADGTEPRFPQPDPRFVEGPAGGQVKNGPFG